MTNADQIKLMLAKMAFEGNALADLEDDVHAQGGTARYDNVIEFSTDRLREFSAFKDFSAADFYEAFSYFGMDATVRLLSIFAYSGGLPDMPGVYEALREIIYPDEPEIRDQLPIDSRQPHLSAFNQATMVMKIRAVREDVQLIDIPDTGDGFYFTISLSDICDYLTPTFLKAVFEDALSEFENTPDLSLPRQAYLAQALAFACRRLPYNMHPFPDEKARGTLMDQVQKAINFYTGAGAPETVNDLSMILGRMERLSTFAPLFEDPEAFSVAVYSKALRQKILNILIKDENYVQLRADELLRYRLLLQLT